MIKVILLCATLFSLNLLANPIGIYGGILGEEVPQEVKTEVINFAESIFSDKCPQLLESAVSVYSFFLDENKTIYKINCDIISGTNTVILLSKIDSKITQLTLNNIWAKGLLDAANEIPSTFEDVVENARNGIFLDFEVMKLSMGDTITTGLPIHPNMRLNWYIRENYVSIRGLFKDK